MMLDNSFQPCILEPTRMVNGHKPSIVDNIFSNSVEKCISGYLFDKISDHLPSFVIFENCKTKPKPKHIKRRSMKQLDPLKYQGDLNLILQTLQADSNLDDAETSFNFFHKKYLAVINKHAPIQILTRKQQELELKPWITNGILNSTRVKAKLFKLFKKTKINRVLCTI